MSEDYADETMRTIVSWARYAELFAYDEGSRRRSSLEILKRVARATTAHLIRPGHAAHFPMNAERTSLAVC